jgi:hypothetical protein
VRFREQRHLNDVHDVSFSPTGALVYTGAFDRARETREIWPSRRDGSHSRMLGLGDTAVVARRADDRLHGAGGVPASSPGGTIWLRSACDDVYSVDESDPAARRRRSLTTPTAPTSTRRRLGGNNNTRSRSRSKKFGPHPESS